MKEKIKKMPTIILIAIVILVCIYGFIIESTLTRAHCKEIAREEARENCRYGDIDCIIDYYEYFYNLCLEHN